MAAGQNTPRREGMGHNPVKVLLIEGRNVKTVLVACVVVADLEEQIISQAHEGKGMIYFIHFCIYFYSIVLCTENRSCLYRSSTD